MSIQWHRERNLLIAFISYSLLDEESKAKSIRLKSEKSSHLFELKKDRNNDLHVIDKMHNKSIRISKNSKGWDAIIEPSKSYISIQKVSDSALSVYDYASTCLYDAKKIDDDEIGLEDIFSNNTSNYVVA